MRKCRQCGRPMNPAQFVVNATCLECARENHRAMMGGRSRRSRGRKGQNFCPECGSRMLSRPYDYYCQHCEVAFPKCSEAERRRVK
jgi:DNA-directed RNA polymerase subunit RPC12/RpoP